MNIVLITSVINISNNPLSYSKTRSFCDSSNRFEDTLKTINSARKYIKNSLILLIECSDLSKHDEKVLNESVDIFINVYKEPGVVEKVNSNSKSLGEATLTVKAIEYLLDNNIRFNNLFKISGRYWLNDNFDYSKFDNNNIVVRYINPRNPIVSTVLYKIPSDIIKELFYFLINSEDELINCIGYEMIFTSFIKTYNDCKIIKDKIGVNGYISIDGCYIVI